MEERQAVPMTVSGVLWRYAVAFLVLGVLVAAIANATGLKSSLKIAILIGAISWPCLAFKSRNGRYFSAGEKTRVVWGMIAINLLLETVVAALALLAIGKLEFKVLAGALVFIGVLHSLFIWFWVGFIGKDYGKAKAKAAGTS
jgi:hypothetical protein